MPDFGRWSSNGGDPSLNDINRTDQFLDALATQQPVFATDHGEAELAQLLAGWRDDIRETPMEHVATPQVAAATLDRVTAPAPRRRFSLAVVGSAAAAMLAIGGFGAVIAGSGPGDAMYGLRTMMFGEQTQTRDDAVILAAQTEMQQVQQLIEQGDWQGAQAKLEAVTTTVATVDDFESKQQLVTQWQELTVKVEAQDPAATLPPEVPLPTFPDVPVAVLDQGTTSSETSSATSSATSSETTPPSSSETTAPTSASSPTTAPSPSETTTPAPSVTSTSVGAPSPSSSSAPSPSASPSSIPPSTSPTRAPSPTSTTVIHQSTTVTRAPLPSSTSVAAPAPSTTPSPTPSPTPIPTPTAAPPAAEETVPSSTPQVLPTTTTPIVGLPLPGEPG
jgi:hypothetical protein